MSLFDELQKKQREQPRAWDYLKWAVVAVLVAAAVVAAVVLMILAIHPEGARKFIDSILHHVYIHYGLIPVLVLLLIVVVAAIAFVVQLVFTYIVYWKAYSEKRGEGAGSWRPELVDKPARKSGWSRGYYQGVVLLFTNAVVAVLIIASGIYGLGYIGIDVAEQPEFCTMCHEVMIKPYESYAASTHKGIACGECHNDPGVKGFVKGEVIAPMKEGWLQAAGDYNLHEPMVVPINNESCLRSECHKEKRLLEEEFHHNTLVFRHKKHLELEHGGETLSCAACHAYDKKLHMAVDYRVCGLCHFSVDHVSTKDVPCQDCHVGRPKMEEHRVELLHREVVDFEHLPCNDCHEVKRVKLAVTSETCSKRCHHHHGGKEKISGGAVKSHAIHRSARCMDCHEEVEHKMGSEKFLSVQRSPFGKQFKHRGHMELDCTECHVERDGHFVQKLKSRADCSRCHHDGVEDADMCEGCHDTQSEFFKGSGKFGFEETPSMKAEMETGCDACHGDVRKYEPKQLTESCTNCHEEGDADYDLAKLLDGGKKALGDAMTKLKSLKDEITAAGEKGVKAEMLESAGRAAGEVEKMLAFLRNDASFGLHNPGLFSEYISKANEMVGEALKQLKEESK